MWCSGEVGSCVAVSLEVRDEVRGLGGAKIRNRAVAVRFQARCVKWRWGIMGISGSGEVVWLEAQGEVMRFG